MAKHSVRSTWDLVRLAAVLGLLFFAVRTGVAQESPVGPGQARETLRFAIDLYKRGDFEKAAGYFTIAGQAQANLDATDKADFATFQPPATPAP